MACNTLEGTHTTTVQWTPGFLVPFYVEGILRCFFLETVVLNLTLQFSQSVENNDVRDSGDTDAQNDAKDLNAGLKKIENAWKVLKNQQVINTRRTRKTEATSL